MVRYHEQRPAVRTTSDDRGLPGSVKPFAHPHADCLRPLDRRKFSFRYVRWSDIDVALQGSVFVVRAHAGRERDPAQRSFIETNHGQASEGFRDGCGVAGCGREPRAPCPRTYPWPPLAADTRNATGVSAVEPSGRQRVRRPGTGATAGVRQPAIRGWTPGHTQGTPLPPPVTSTRDNDP